MTIYKSISETNFQPMKTYITIILVSFFQMFGCKEPLQEVEIQEKNNISQIVKTEQSIVFIAGFDEGKNTYYENAKKHFENKNMKIVENLFSLEEIILWLNKNHDYKNYNEIHIVSHSNAWLGMSLKTTKKGERITAATLMNLKKEEGMPKLENYITKNTKLIFHSCGLGENQELLQELKAIFTTEQSPLVYASSFFNVFGGKYAAHYLAKPFYGYYPTAESSGPRAISKEFELKYPNENIDWFTALKTRQERTVGEVYTYKFNIPVNWEFTFNDVNEIPDLQNKDQIMDWISEDDEMATTIFKLGIPIEKYRWRVSIDKNKLVIKGKTTVLCVMKPIMQSNDKNEYRLASIADKELYQIL